MDKEFQLAVAALQGNITALCENHEKESKARSDADSRALQFIADSRSLLLMSLEDKQDLKPDLAQLETMLTASHAHLVLLTKPEASPTACMFEVENRTSAMRDLIYLFNQWLEAPRTAQYQETPKLIRSLVAKACPDGPQQMLHSLTGDARQCLTAG